MTTDSAYGSGSSADDDVSAWYSHNAVTTANRCTECLGSGVYRVDWDANRVIPCARCRGRGTSERCSDCGSPVTDRHRSVCSRNDGSGTPVGAK